VEEAETEARMLTFVSDRSPRKNESALSEGGASQMQQLINVTGAAYFDALARFRGADATTVHETYGLGAVFGAADALARGMIDAVMVADALHAQLGSSVELPPIQDAPAALRLSASTTFSDRTSMADTPPDENVPAPAAAFAAGAAVRSAVTRNVAIAENDEGTVVEVLEGQTIYAVEFAGGVYNYVTEADLAPVDGAEPSATQSRVRSAIAAGRVARERDRVAAIAGLAGRVPAATISAAIADPAQTAGSVALAHLTAGKPSPLAALQADAAGTPATPTAPAPETPLAAASARAARINKRYAVGGRDTSRSVR
jgi:hypothetical protein